MLPVKNGAPKRYIELWVNGVNTRFFEMELAEEKPAWYAYLQINEWNGKDIELSVDKVTVGSKVFMPVQQSIWENN